MGAQNKIPSFIKRFQSTPMPSVHLGMEIHENPLIILEVFFLTFDIFNVTFIFIHFT
jgi:hypothetical protein